MPFASFSSGEDDYSTIKSRDYSKSVVTVDNPIKLCIKADEYNYEKHPITFYSIAPDDSELTEDIRKTLLGLTGDKINYSIQLTIEISINTDDSRMYKVNVLFNEFNQVVESPTSEHDAKLLTDKLTYFLFNKIYNDNTLYYYLIHQISINGKFYVTFDFMKKRNPGVGETVHRDKTNFIILSLFKEEDTTCEYIETTSVALSPMDYSSTITANITIQDETDIRLHTQLSKIFKENPSEKPCFLRFALRNCTNNTIIVKDDICVHRAPGPNKSEKSRIRDMFRFKFGANPSLFNRELAKFMFTYDIPLDYTSSDRISYIDSLEISIDEPTAEDGLFTFNKIIQSGSIKIGRSEVDVFGGRKTKKNKNGKSKKLKHKSKKQRKTKSRK
jgi:hypothetical protein